MNLIYSNVNSEIIYPRMLKFRVNSEGYIFHIVTYYIPRNIF